MCCAYLLTLSAHVKQGLQYLVCVSVCLLPRFLPLCATRQPKSGTKGFSAQCYTRMILCKSKVMVCKQRWKSQYANEYCLVSTCLCHFAYHESISFQVVNQMQHSNATYKYSYPVGTRIERLWVRGCGLYACVYIAVACIYNYSTHALYPFAKLYAPEGLHFSAFHAAAVLKTHVIDIQSIRSINGVPFSLILH